jgi:hypothetical protein
MAEEFCWQSKICTYECKRKISFNYGISKCYSFKKYISISIVSNILIFNLIMTLIFYFLKY